MENEYRYVQNEIPWKEGNRYEGVKDLEVWALVNSVCTVKKC